MVKSLKNYWTADFETTTDLDDCRVWAFSLCNIDDCNKFEYGNSLDGFFDWIMEYKGNLKIWFHNAKFDFQFLLSYLLEHDFTWIENKEDRADFTFTTLISDMGQFYSIVVYFKVKGSHIHKVEFYDSFKIFPNFSVERLAEAFKLPISKLKIDYRAYREVGHQLTQEEIEYIRNDVEITARALHEMFTRGLTRMTIASDAMMDFKKRIVGFRKKFPELPTEIDLQIRKSYRGGFTYASDKWTGKIVENVVTLDVNSLYPAMMLEPLPTGKPVRFEGKYEPDVFYPLYVQSFCCRFDIKPDKIPTIQIKNSMSFIPNEYLKSSNGCIVELTLTKPDFELFMEHYNVSYIDYTGGFKFMQARGFFDNYINYWTEQKIQAGKDGNASLRQIAKLMLNSLYGRLAIGGTARQKSPVLCEDGVVRYRTMPAEERPTCYIPAGTWITSLGRCKTIRTSQAIRDFTEKKYGEDRYYYSDTDSIKATLTDEDLEELKDIVELDDFKLGFWALETRAELALFLRQKCYIQKVDGKIHATVAGLPKYLSPLINFENFKHGFSTKGMTIEDMQKLAKENGASEEEIEAIHHKLMYTYTRGGVVLTDTDFTIK